ncbi:MAG: acyl-CoA thioesterase [Hyphomicrobiaceae bacterium]|mgnify:CR=1 FL=1|nr:acyl-CoA thioesterase [Hyphomicrobiaceae bacterium]
MRAEKDLTLESSFNHWTPVTMRWSDTDALIHINNVAIAAYIEAARVAYYHDLMARAAVNGPRLDIVLVRLLVNYRKEFFYPGTVRVGTRLIGTGNTSVVSGYGVFVDGEAKATAECVNVFFDTQKRQKVVPPPALKAVLEAEMAA